MINPKTCHDHEGHQFLFHVVEEPFQLIPLWLLRLIWDGYVEPFNDKGVSYLKEEPINIGSVITCRNVPGGPVFVLSKEEFGKDYTIWED